MGENSTTKAKNEYDTWSLAESALLSMEIDIEPTIAELLTSRADGSHPGFLKPKQAPKFKRANKNRPAEASSRVPVTRFRQVKVLNKEEFGDPRFGSRNPGKADIDAFKRNYSFLREDIIPAEREELKKKLMKVTDPDVARELRDHISWMNKQAKILIPTPVVRTDSAILAEHKKKEREAAKLGKRPYYLKKSEIRRQTLVEQYEKLKASGKLDSFIEKRRKKKTSKDRKSVPYRRQERQQN